MAKKEVVKGLLEQVKAELQQVNEKIDDLYATARENDVKADLLAQNEPYLTAEIKALRGQARQDREQAKYLADTVRTPLNGRVEVIEKKVEKIKVDIKNAEIELENCTSYREKYKKEYENRLAMIEHEEETAKWHLEQGKLELLKLEGGE